MALALAKKAFGEENVQTAKHYGNLGRLYQSMHRYTVGVGIINLLRWGTIFNVCSDYRIVSGCEIVREIGNFVET